MNQRNLMAGCLLLLTCTKFDSIAAPGTETSSGSTITVSVGLASTAQRTDTTGVTIVTAELVKTVSTAQNVPATSVTGKAGTTAEEATTTDGDMTTPVTATIADSESTESTETTEATNESVGSSSTDDQTETNTAVVSPTPSVGLTSTENSNFITDNSSRETAALTTTKVIEDNTGSLTGGEIAAIVICPIVLAVLIPSVVLIVIRHKRRNDRYEHFYLITRDED